MLSNGSIQDLHAPTGGLGKGEWAKKSPFQIAVEQVSRARLIKHFLAMN